MHYGDYQSGNLLDYVKSVLRHTTVGNSGKVLSVGIEKLLEKGRVTLLFDALDEALGERREIVLAELNALIQSRAYCFSPIIISSRIREEPGNRLKDLQVFEITNLSNEAIQTFITVYKRPEYGNEEIWKLLERYDLLRQDSLGRNPFWLKLIIQSGVFKQEKVQILDRSIDALFSREWDEKPESKRSWRRVLSKEVQIDSTKRCLALLAFQMSKENQNRFDLDRARNQTEMLLKQHLDTYQLRFEDVCTAPLKLDTLAKV